ncbi:MAG: hypothetical protein ABFD92_15195 [Planctomycetaceae bacterium]|nr:hypothetical protein [Planctomycetaceae bacterium]
MTYATRRGWQIGSAIVMAVAVLLGCFMFVKARLMCPVLFDIYAKMGVSLPALTQWLMLHPPYWPLICFCAILIGKEAVPFNPLVKGIINITAILAVLAAMAVFEIGMFMPLYGVLRNAAAC